LVVEDKKQKKCSRLKTKIFLKNGEEYYMKYMHTREDIDMIPFQYSDYDIPIYMADGLYELDDNTTIIIKDKKIISIK
jgi:hypothetical protein